MNDGIEQYDISEIEEQRFICTKKKVKELLDAQKKPFQIRKIKSPEDLQQLIEEL